MKRNRNSPASPAPAVYDAAFPRLGVAEIVDGAEYVPLLFELDPEPDPEPDNAALAVELSSTLSCVLDAPDDCELEFDAVCVVLAAACAFCRYAAAPLEIGLIVRYA